MLRNVAGEPRQAVDSMSIFENPGCTRQFANEKSLESMTPGSIRRRPAANTYGQVGHAALTGLLGILGR